jgi:abortive infection bacteriophage resistance protein
MFSTFSPPKRLKFHKIWAIDKDFVPTILHEVQVSGHFYRILVVFYFIKNTSTSSKFIQKIMHVCCKVEEVHINSHVQIHFFHTTNYQLPKPPSQTMYSSTGLWHLYGLNIDI